MNPPLEMSLKEQLVDQYFAYITVNAEAPPPDIHLEGNSLRFVSENKDDHARSSVRYIC